MEILLFTSFLLIAFVFFSVLKTEKIFIRLAPIFFLVLFLSGHALIELKFKDRIFRDNDDQVYFIKEGRQCIEGSLKDIYNPFELKKGFPNPYPFTFTSCLFHKYSYAPVFALRFFNFILFILMILLMYQSVLLITQSKRHARIAGLLVCMGTSFQLYQFYFLRDLAICFLSALIIFFTVTSFFGSKKIIGIFLSLLGLLLAFYCQYTLRMHAISVGIMFLANFIGIVVIEKTKVRVPYYLVVIISFLYYWNYSIGDFLVGKFEFSFFFKNPSRVVALTKEFLLNFSGIGFIIPSYGVHDTWITWVLKRSITFDRLLYPLIFIYFLFKVNLKQKILFFFLSVPGYYIYEAVYYYYREYHTISLGFGFRHAIVFYIYFPFFIPWMAFLNNKNRKNARLTLDGRNNFLDILLP